MASNPEQHAQLDLEHFLPYRLSVLSNRISQAIARLYNDRFDLSVTQWRVVAVLGRYPNISAGEVAERTAMDKVAVSRTVASLMETRVVSRSMHIDDRRRSVLCLSTTGYAIYDEVAPLARAFEQRILKQLEQFEISQLDAVLSHLQSLNFDALAAGDSDHLQ